MQKYNLGTAPTTTASFEKEDGSPVDPTNVEMLIMYPDGTEVPLSPANDGLGIWRASIPMLTMHGIHRVKVWGTGTVVVSDEIRFEVMASRFSA